MALVAEYLADPGCCKADAAWATGLYMKTFIVMSTTERWRCRAS
jgi:hypothetical protein